MCDLYSWISYKDAEGNNKIAFLEDDQIESKWAPHSDLSYRDYIGHESIMQYYQDPLIRAGDHCESLHKVPAEMARRINLGKLRRMTIGAGEDPSARYSVKSNCHLKTLAERAEAKHKRDIEKASKAQNKASDALLPLFPVGTIVKIGKHTCLPSGGSNWVEPMNDYVDHLATIDQHRGKDAANCNCVDLSITSAYVWRIDNLTPATEAEIAEYRIDHPLLTV